MRRLRGNILRLFTLVYPVPEEGTCGNWGEVLSVIFWELARITGWSEYEMLGFSKCSSRFEIRVRNVVWILSSIYLNIYQILFWVTWLYRFDCPPQNRLRKDKARTRKKIIPLSKVIKVIVKDPIQRLCALVCFCMRLAPQLRLVKPRQRRSLHKYKNNMDVGLRFSSPCDSTAWLLERVSLPHDSTAWLTEGGDSLHVSSIPRFYTNGVDAPNCEIGVLFLGSENEASWRFLSNDFVAQGHHYRRRMQQASSGNSWRWCL